MASKTDIDVVAVTQEWLNSRVRKGRLSRNTIAVGLVILDTLRRNCPLKRTDILSDGGEIKGSRSGLGKILTKYSIPAKFLKEATTRQSHQDGIALLETLRFGSTLGKLSQSTRDRDLESAIAILIEQANQWLMRQNLKVSCDRQLSPSVWFARILEESRKKSGGKVEQHLVGAKLQARHPEWKIPNHPGHAADKQTGRSGDFEVGSVSYHVTATPGKDVLQKCRSNAEANKHPVLIVPTAQLSRAKILAEEEGIAPRLTLLSLEDFLAQNVIEISTQRRTDFYSTFSDIVSEYNRRIDEAETDMALKIEIQ